MLEESELSGAMRTMDALETLRVKVRRALATRLQLARRPPTGKTCCSLLARAGEARARHLDMPDRVHVAACRARGGLRRGAPATRWPAPSLRAPGLRQPLALTSPTRVRARPPCVQSLRSCIVAWDPAVKPRKLSNTRIARGFTTPASAPRRDPAMQRAACDGHVGTLRDGLFVAVDIETERSLAQAAQRGAELRNLCAGGAERLKSHARSLELLLQHSRDMHEELEGASDALVAPHSPPSAARPRLCLPWCAERANATDEVGKIRTARMDWREKESVRRVYEEDMLQALELERCAPRPPPARPAHVRPSLPLVAQRARPAARPATATRPWRSICLPARPPASWALRRPRRRGMALASASAAPRSWCLPRRRRRRR